MKMSEIEALTKDYADKRRALGHEVVVLSGALAKVKNRRLPHLRKRAADLKEAEDKLRTAVEKNPQLFERPKSRVFHDTRIGYQKRPGAVGWDDAEAVVARIKKLFPTLVGSLIKTKETPNKVALSTLSARDLKRLGVSVGDGGDVSFVKPADSDLDKIVAVYLGDDT